MCVYIHYAGPRKPLEDRARMLGIDMYIRLGIHTHIDTYQIRYIHMYITYIYVCVYTLCRAAQTTRRSCSYVGYRYVYTFISD